MSVQIHELLIGSATVPLATMTKAQRRTHERAYEEMFPRVDATPPNRKLERAQAEMRARMKPQPQIAPPPPIVDTFGERHYSVRQLADTLGYHKNTIIREADRFLAKHGWGVRWVGQKKKRRAIAESAARLFFTPGN